MPRNNQRYGATRYTDDMPESLPDSPWRSEPDVKPRTLRGLKADARLSVVIDSTGGRHKVGRACLHWAPDSSCRHACKTSRQEEGESA